MAMTTLILYASLALGVSFLCSILEAVVLSIPHTYIAVLEKDGKKSGAIWANLKEDDAVKPLTAILTLNTIAHTMGAAGVGSRSPIYLGRECPHCCFYYSDNCCLILVRNHSERP